MAHYTWPIISPMTTNDHACVAMTPWITLHSTPWISDFHVNYCFEHVPKLCEHASSMGVLEGGGGGGGATGFLV